MSKDIPAKDIPAAEDTSDQSAPRPSTSAPATILPASAHKHQHLTNGQARTGDSLPNLGDMDARCGGCQQVIDQESGGVVVAFGSNLWHVDCFRCAKCKERVSADTNLLLLSDGSPVCGNCSYQCFVCKQAITEEAIMTGDESYHAHCFTCRTCTRRIEELVFAKTSQGIYCMACHNERVARSRRHAEQKRQRAARREKEREREDTQRRDREEGGSNQASSSRSPSAMTLGSPAVAAPTSVLSPNMSPSATPNSASSGQFPDNPSIPEDGARPRELSVDRSMPRSLSPIGRLAEQMPLPASPSDASHSTKGTPGLNLNGSPQNRRQGNGNNGNFTPSLGTLAPLGESNSSPSFGQSPSRGLNPGLGVGPVGLGPGLGVPMSKAERRRSINPAMTFNIDPLNSTYSAVDGRNSPHPPSPLRTSFTDLQAEQQAPRSPTSPSPAHIGADGFPFKAPVLGSVPQQSGTSSNDGPPPRTSSLPDQLSSHDEPRPHVSPSLPPKLPNGLNGGSGESSSLLKTPQIQAPTIRPMSFSLSDPDFALILNSIDQSPKEQEETSPKTGRSGVTIRPEVQEVSASESSTSSPVAGVPASTSSPALARSPQMDMLSSAVEAVSIEDQHDQPSSQALSSRSPTRSRLSPSAAGGAGSTPQLLRTRQPSAESTTSVNSRLGVDSSFISVIELIAAAKHNGKDSVQIDLNVLSGVIGEMEDMKDMIVGLKNKYTGAKRTSQQYSEGLTVAGEEYDKELAHRRELEAEVIRLRAQVHSQTARLSVISGDERRQENLRRRSHDLANSLTGLERDISKLRAQRDMTLAEVEELNITRNSDATSEEAAAALSRSLTSRLDTIKEQYRDELEPLTAQREALHREINELRETREQFLEESTALAAKNEDLAELNAQLSRQNELLQDSLARARAPTIFGKNGRSHPSGSPSLSSLATSATLQEVPEETARVVKVSKPEPIEAAPARRFKWYKSSKGPEASTTSASISKPLALPPDKRGNLQRPSTEFGLREHNFHQHSTMRFTRCELCQEKMWGLQEVRCANCGVVCHSKCSDKLPRSCTGNRNGHVETLDENAAPSMFGRDLAEQVAADNATVPVIVSKCIAAVEVVAMEYEGIYRKTGGSSQSKQITQLFERGDYDSFDLADVESFNDISSVTSVLKTYFRQLPNPLLTHALHESFVAAASIRDTNNKHSALCALLKELPRENYNTLRALMLHLNRVTSLSSVNLMTSQNLGVVFGPTLMRSSDPNREFGDMAGKALTVQWMVDNAPNVLTEIQGEPSSQIP